MRTPLAASVFLLAVCAGPSPAAGLPWLHASGTQIVDEKGDPVLLRGVNLGGWLVEEVWMMPFETKPPEGSGFPEIKDHVSLWAVVEKRFGAAEMQRVRTALRSAWITDADFARVRAAGLNCVRLPFTCDLLDEPDGLAWLDRAIDTAAAHGLYTILDLHGAPGRQSGEHHTGEAGVDRLFRDPESVARTEALWRTLARRYRDRPEVAAYDLLNEPMGAPNATTLHLVHDRLYRAVREADPRHLVIIEDGYKGGEFLPNPALAGWSGVVYSTHHYQFNAKSEQDQTAAADAMVERVAKLAAEREVPWLVGEFQLEPHGTPAVMAHLVQAMAQRQISWTVWTYKTAMKNGTGGMWGWVHSPGRLQPIDPFRQSAAEMLQGIEQVRSERLEANEALGQAFGAQP